MKYERITNKEDGYICKHPVDLQTAISLLRLVENLLEEEIYKNICLKKYINKKSQSEHVETERIL